MIMPSLIDTGYYTQEGLVKTNCALKRFAIASLATQLISLGYYPPFRYINAYCENIGGYSIIGLLLVY